MLFRDYLNKIEHSFKLANKGQENLQTIIRWWGFLSYIFFFFIVDKIIHVSDIRILNIILSSVSIIYFSWHIFALKKNEPKKPKLSKEEKKKIRQEKLKNLPRSFMRKLLLQEPISKWNSVHVMIAVDLLLITNFIGYILEK